MKKIGILTFHRAVNYGALLQAYALVETLQEIGANAEVIDYKNDKIEKSYYTRRGLTNSLKSMLRNVYLFPIQQKRNKAFQRTLEQYLRLSKTSYTKQTIGETEKIYDFIITGSDQVWNLPCTNGDKTYFLDFINEPKKKKSYAASFGKIKGFEKEYKQYLELIKTFSAISVREENGKHFLQDNNIEENIRVDIDPVFLLNRKKWMEFEKTPDFDDYILVYSVNLPNGILKYAREQAKKLGKEMIIVTLRNKKIKLLKNEKNYSCCTPNEFVGLINHASLVVTNSFHGTAFSIILHKNFVVVRNSTSSAAMDNSRLDNILNIMQLANRFSDRVKLNENINYTEVDRIIRDLRENSLDYLRLLV